MQWVVLWDFIWIDLVPANIAFCLYFISIVLILTYYQLSFNSHAGNISRLKGICHFLAKENNRWEDRKMKESHAFRTVIGLEIFHLLLPFKPAKGLKRWVGKQTTIFCYHSALETSTSMSLYVITSSSFLLLLWLCPANYLDF